MLECPVCADRVDQETAPTSLYQGVIHYFRCPRCKERFDAAPERFLRNGADAGHPGFEREHASAGHGPGGPPR